DTAPTPGAKPATAGLNEYRPMARTSAAALIIVIFLRQWVHSAMTTYLPQWIVAQGYSIEVASNLLFALLLPLALGGLLGGSLADRVGRKPVILTSLIGIIPLILLLLNSPLPLQFFIAPVLGIVIGASFPITLVMAQELLPRGIGIMSGLALGFTFIAGSIGVAITGRVADAIGLHTTLTGLAVVALVGVCAASLLPRRERRTADMPIPQTADVTPNA
ncbi:MAG: MFS transporter, partial [Anaerolineae bacterium]|nr:MFS transporter [Anaerolineae bacterium]